MCFSVPIMEEEYSKNIGIWKKLKTEFGRAPKLVLSVIGDSKCFVPRAWPKSVFQRALIEAGRSSGGGSFVVFVLTSSIQHSSVAKDFVRYIIYTVFFVFENLMSLTISPF